MLIHHEESCSPNSISLPEGKVNQDAAQLERELARALQYSQQLERDCQGLLERAAMGIFRMTVEGRYLWVNEAFARIYGYHSPEEFLQIFPTFDPQLYVEEEQYCDLQNLIKTRGTIESFETKICRRDGEAIWISETGRIIRDEQGNSLYYEGWVADITQHKQMERACQELETKYKTQTEQLQQINLKLAKAESQLMQGEKLSSLGELVAGIAHEIKNPVGFTCGNLIPARQYANDLMELLALYQEYYPEPVDAIAEAIEDIELDFLKEDFPKVLASMELGTERIRKIVKSLSYFARLDETCMNPVNIHEGLDSTLTILTTRLKATADKPEIKIEKNYGDLPDRIPCYGGLLNQVFMNLLSNAIDALEDKYTDVSDGEVPPVTAGGETRTSPKIWLQTRQEGDWIKICIRDNAGGIPAEMKEQIFESFFTTKPPGKGTGLGLSISQEIIVRKHHGRLECFSTPGEGTEFAIAIPLHDNSY
ncbi:MAG: sensor histidine kinase [Spirulina sp.]